MSRGDDAIRDTDPNGRMHLSEISARKSGRGKAIVEILPTGATPSRKKLGRHTATDTHPVGATNADEGGQRNSVTPNRSAPSSATPSARKKAGTVKAKDFTIPTRATLPLSTNSDGHALGDTHFSTAIGDEEGGHKSDVTQTVCAPSSSLIQTIVISGRRRRQWKRAIVKLELQESAICRSLCEGDKEAAQKLRAAIIKGKSDNADAFIALMPLMAARKIIEEQCTGVEKELRKLARQLPVWDAFALGVRGFGDLRLALIVGEANGAIGDYRSVSAFWKRMGLAVIDGGRQRKVTGDAALEHGYSPERRAVAWNLGGELIKGCDPKYRAIYDKRKEYELERVATKIHAHNRAMRYMTKCVLRDLWSAWRTCDRSQSTFDTHPLNAPVATNSKVNND